MFKKGDKLVLSERGRKFFSGRGFDWMENYPFPWVFDGYTGGMFYGDEEKGRVITFQGMRGIYTDGFFEHETGPW